MKIELVEEINPGTGTMYAVAKDGKGIKWFSQKDTAEAYYNQVLANPEILKPQRNILKSEEINVSLEEQNN
jgi:ATP-dependent Clp protease adapter protein ClpS